MKKNTIHTVGIIGLGLIGTSFGMALKRSTTLHVKGLTRSKTNRKHALEKRAVDCLTSTVPEILQGTDLIILATPIQSIISLLTYIGTITRTPLIVTDTGSTKEEICKIGQRLPTKITFIGGHPLAGKEASGSVHADRHLFEKRPWVLTPASRCDHQILSAVRSLLAQTGAIPIELSPTEHDHIVTGISHLPFIISTLLMETIQTHPDWMRGQSLAGTGFRDMTRLAQGDPTMHTDILRTNHKTVLAELTRFEVKIQNLKQKIKTEHWTAVEERFVMIKNTRIRWERNHL